MDSPFAELLQSLSKLPHFLTNPQEDPELAAISIGMIVAAGLIIVALLILFYLRISNRRNKKRSAPGRGSSSAHHRTITTSAPRKNRTSVGFAIKVLAGMAFVFAIFATGPISVSQPQFCLSCHQSKAAHESWKKSTHSGLGCLACHKAPGAIGALELVSQGAGNAAATYFGTPGTGGGAKVRTAACLRCHTDITAGTTSNRDIRISHAEFLEQIPACTSCHQNAGHDRANSTDAGDTATAPVKDISVMERCGACHDGTKAFASCQGCHTRDIGRQAHVNPDDLPRISLSSPDLCVQCHREEILVERKKAAAANAHLVERTCTQCHTLERLKTSGIGADGWPAIVQRMRLKGADFDAPEGVKILNYLQVTFP